VVELVCLQCQRAGTANSFLIGAITGRQGAKLIEMEMADMLRDLESEAVVVDLEGGAMVTSGSIRSSNPTSNSGQRCAIHGSDLRVVRLGESGSSPTTSIRREWLTEVPPQQSFIIPQVDLAAGQLGRANQNSRHQEATISTTVAVLGRHYRGDIHRQVG
jgi:hypothetical protein